jgi:2-oxoglutarate/2-oxoacid ferredoxin oxidoreductase subunit beta
MSTPSERTPQNTPRVDSAQIGPDEVPPAEGQKREASFASADSTSGTNQPTGDDNGRGGVAVAPRATVTGANRIGLLRDTYKGSPTTLCAGCGHNAITNHIIKAFYDYGINPYYLAKMSGIGCSSKAPDYFVSRSHGFNSVHGRMPSVATGAKLANRKLVIVGISGDGDTASIGLGQYCHMIRRNLDMVYICEDNGVYGLTKGQFSATADLGSIQKGGKPNEFETIDICGLAIELGASFVARSFSGDGKQVVPLIQAALAHQGAAILDIISPCVTFNDHEGSTKSYAYVKEHDIEIQDLDFIPYYENIQVDYEEGTASDVELHDGSHVRLRKVARGEHDPTDRTSAMRLIHEARQSGELLTGLLYVNPKMKDLNTLEHLPEKPLKDMTEAELRMTREQFEELMGEYAN